MFNFIKKEILKKLNSNKLINFFNLNVFIIFQEKKDFRNKNFYALI